MASRSKVDALIDKAKQDRRYAESLMTNFDQETRALKLSDTEKRELKTAIIRMYPGNDW